MSSLQMDPLNPYESFLTSVGLGAQLHLALGSTRASPCCGMNPNLVNCICKAITAVRTNVANLSDAAMWKIKRARFARNRQKSVRSLRDSVKGPVESKRALSLPETLTTKIRWVSIYVFVSLRIVSYCWVHNGIVRIYPNRIAKLGFWSIWAVFGYYWVWQGILTNIISMLCLKCQKKCSKTSLWMHLNFKLWLIHTDFV